MHVNYTLDPACACIQLARPMHHVISPLSFVAAVQNDELVSDRRRRLTRQRVQRHRGRTDMVRRETAIATDHKRLGRQKL